VQTEEVVYDITDVESHDVKVKEDDES